MDTIHYLNIEQVEELKSQPKTAFEWFDAFELKLVEPFSDKYKCCVENIVCYSEKYLHIIVKSDQEEMVKNDRSYQNGDGFHFVFAKPREDEEVSKEFYVIGISPLDDTWKNRFVWYKNIDLGGTFLKDTQIIMNDNEAYIFHVMIPWHEIEPINGYLMKDYGYNISYVQAHKEGKNVYILKEDDHIQSEQSPREYRVLEFEKPKGLSFECLGQLSSKHGSIEDDLSLNVAFSSPVLENVEIILKGEDMILQEHIQCEGFLNRVFNVNKESLKSGKQVLECVVKTTSLTKIMPLEYTLYDEKVYDELTRSVKNIEIDDQNLLLAESIHTLCFDIQTLKEQLSSLKYYESFDMIDAYHQNIVSKVEHVKEGSHLFEREAFIRLGHLNDYDQTLQPYSLYIPKIINDRTKLMIYLHGSGSDDTSIKYAPNMKTLADETNTILLAPYARGTSHFYCSKESIEEVLELTQKAIKWFQIKKENVIISGFSMGGYGTYRLFDAGRGLYAGMIVLSGHPGLGKSYDGPDYFEHMDIFSKVPMIVGHGAWDRNCDYAEQLTFFEALKHINNKCQILIKEDIGHCGLISDWYEPIKLWIGEHYGD